MYLHLGLVELLRLRSLLLVQKLVLYPFLWEQVQFLFTTNGDDDQVPGKILWPHDHYFSCWYLIIGQEDIRFCQALGHHSHLNTTREWFTESQFQCTESNTRNCVGDSDEIQNEFNDNIRNYLYQQPFSTIVILQSVRQWELWPLLTIVTWNRV